jgi:hypothetical protein
MDKNILAAVVRLDKSETLVIIEPLHNPGNRNCRGRIGGASLRAWRIAKSARRRSPFRSASGVNLDDARDLGTFCAIAHINLQLRTRGHGLISGCLKRANMQERVAGSIGQLDEAESFITLKPFDDRVDAGSGWRRDFRASAARPEARSRGPAPRCIIGRWPIVVETALFGSPEVSTFAHDLPARLTPLASYTPSLCPHGARRSKADLAAVLPILKLTLAGGRAMIAARKRKGQRRKVPAQHHADGQ